ncbi:hypothetical protein ASE86_11235 [Sphingomonas sp. Leaf33]|uniref:hypothetical protein n=1 Tax=Sphingomonas sp. Leaf33 TaxID=1736215 RepID=UPI0006F541E5|nr:hypothetical protein [Sphingomonas sp. Leaf33]KQN26639.1 hypothetical protein ASE86_11235 [Sphingomonas sp. Leaf33]
MTILSTEVEFTLPIGYHDGDGTLHRDGVMRLATAGDEILPLRDHRVQANPAYLTIIVLSRVVTRLGTLEMVNTKVIEDLFARDFAYLQDLYNRVNGIEQAGGDLGAALGK